MKRYVAAIFLTVCLAGCMTHSGLPTPYVKYSGQEGSLQQIIDTVPSRTTIIFDSKKEYVFTAPLTIKKAITLKGLNARLPEKLGRTPLILVEAAGVTLANITLHGNYDSVDQKDRAPLIRIRRGGFRVEDCTFYDSSKDGVEVSPARRGKDIVGGIIKNIEAFRIGRDAVSISGGNRGLRVRDVVVENISLKKGYLKGAVEVSDGTDNIMVRGVYAEDCLYAIDVQNHKRRKGFANTNISIRDVTAVNCRHIIRTANSPRGHANLKLHNLTAKSCEFPVQIWNTKNVKIDGLRVLNHRSQKYPPIAFKNCQGLSLRNVTIETAHFADRPVKSTKCESLDLDGLSRPTLLPTY